MAFHIIYPSGDRSRIKVAEFDAYEINDYALASRHEFCDFGSASHHAQFLARTNNKIYVRHELDEPDYLD